MHQFGVAHENKTLLKSLHRSPIYRDRCLCSCSDRTILIFRFFDIFQVWGPGLKVTQGILDQYQLVKHLFICASFWKKKCLKRTFHLGVSAIASLDLSTWHLSTLPLKFSLADPFSVFRELQFRLYMGQNRRKCGTTTNKTIDDHFPRPRRAGFCALMFIGILVFCSGQVRSRASSKSMIKKA